MDLENRRGEFLAVGLPWKKITNVSAHTLERVWERHVPELSSVFLKQVKAKLLGFQASYLMFKIFGNYFKTFCIFHVAKASCISQGVWSFLDKYSNLFHSCVVRHYEIKFKYLFFKQTSQDIINKK